MASTTLKIMFRLLFLSIFNWNFFHIPVLWCLWTRRVFDCVKFPLSPTPSSSRGKFSLSGLSLWIRKQSWVAWLIKYKATYWFYTHSIFLVPFQCSIEEVHGNVLVLIKPLNDKWLEPPKKEKPSITEGSNYSWKYFLAFGSSHLIRGLL